MGLLFPALWVKACFDALVSRDKSLWSLFILLIKGALLGWIALIVTQQATHINTMWHEKTLEYDNTLKEYEIHRCVSMKTTNRQFLEECERLSGILSLSPLRRALVKYRYSLDSCLTMSCTQLLFTIANNLEYKLLCVILSFGLFYYAYHFIVMTRERLSDFEETARANLTERYKREFAYDPFER